MKKDKNIKIPEGLLRNYFGDGRIANFKQAHTGDIAATVTREKPSKEERTRKETACPCS